jgi:DNA-binding beta-propeller fold protein YncE
LSACSSQQAQAPPPKPAPPPLEFLGEWGIRGDGPGKLSWPTGIAIDTVGNVYIVEGFSRFVHKFTSKGEPLLSFQDDGIKHPGGIAVDSGGAIYVAAFSGKQVIVFLPEGERFRVFSSKSGYPFKGISSLSVDNGGNIFVSESEGHRLRKLDPMGRQIAIWGRKTPRDVAIGRLGPAALGSDGTFYVYDYDNSTILMFNADLEFLHS